MRKATSFRRVANKEYMEEPYSVLTGHHYSMGDIFVNIGGTAAIQNSS